jgi:hypothetical protein
MKTWPMTEIEWQTCQDPTPMVAFLLTKGLASERKLKLFAVACCRRMWNLLTNEQSRRAVEVIERHADGEADDEDLYLAVLGAENVAEALATAGREAEASAAFGVLNATITADYSAANAGSAAYHAATAANAPSAAAARDEERRKQSCLLRDIFGNPFRPAPSITAAVLTWSEGTVVRLARSIYDNRHLPEGTLGCSRFAVLADALQEAGCENEEVLAHCRQEGVHVRGCWLIDLILSKDR